MKIQEKLRWLSTTLMFMLAGCSPSDGSPQTTASVSSPVFQIFDANTLQILTSVTNAFANGQYRGMILDQAIGRDYLAQNWHPTNGFILMPFDGPISSVPVDKAKMAPYLAYFHIVLTPLNTNQTKVAVTTVLSEVIDGKELGFHLTRANHYRKIPPVRQEEENVLSAIVKDWEAQKVLAKDNDK